MHATDDMKIFREIVVRGGISAAARSLGLASSVVADRLAALERRLGVTLLTRTTRRQSLTAAGTLYLDGIEPILDAVGALEVRLAAERDLAEGALRVTAPTPMGRRHLSRFIAAFVGRHPGIRVHLSLEDRYVDIVGEKFDVAVRGGPVIDSSLAGRRLFETRRVVVASPAYLARRGSPRSPADLAGHACLVFNSERHFTAKWRFGRASLAHDWRVEGLLAATNSELPVTWACAGLGLAQKSWWEVADLVAAGRLATVLDDYEPDPVSFFAIHPVSSAKSRKVGLFVEELAADLRDHPLGRDRSLSVAGSGTE